VKSPGRRGGHLPDGVVWEGRQGGEEEERAMQSG